MVFRRLDLPLSSGRMGRGENLLWYERLWVFEPVVTDLQNSSRD